MKRISQTAFLLILFTISAWTIAAQQSTTQPPPLPLEPLTKLELLDTQVGAVIVKNYTYIGSVSGPGGIAFVTAYEFTDVQSGRKDYGIGVEVRESQRAEREGATYVDYEEIESLVRSLDYITKIDKSTTLENFEAQYRTRGELTVSTFIRPNGALQSAVSIGLYKRAEVTLSLGKLVDFRKLIADAKATLDKIR